MAGLGRKTWSAGEVATAANIQGYLQDQTVMKFANTAAAGSALGTAVSEGMTAYLSDTDEQVMYNGTSWFKQNGTTNAIINGAFDIWQRGDSFTQTDFSAGRTYTADRYCMLWNAVPTAVTTSKQTFTPGTAPVAGYEGTYFFRSTLTTIGSTTIWGVQQRVEDVRTFAGQTATFSFWAKADSARNVTIEIVQNFGSGGSTEVAVTSTIQAVTTSWARYTLTVNFPSISGKTIGTNSSVRLTLFQACASGSVLDIWGVQLEAGSVATPFKRNAPSIQAELAACQRYYVRATSAEDLYAPFGQGMATSSTAGFAQIQLPVSMRVSPTSIEYANIGIADSGSAVLGITSLTIERKQTNLVSLNTGVASGLTAHRPTRLLANNSTSAYIGFSADL